MPSKNSKLIRIIDANVNRAVEGLRVVEEVARFVLDNKLSTVKLKTMRNRIRKIVSQLIDNDYQYQQREALKDVGRKVYTKGEARRETIFDVFAANIKRAEEALRVIEEFSKLIKPRVGREAKKIRFELYELEKLLAPRVLKWGKLDFDLYVVTDPRRDHLTSARRAIAGGVKALQLRDKTVSKADYLVLAKKIARITKRAGVTFILNDYWDLVKPVGADGVHLGQEDMDRVSIKKVRRAVGEAGIIGISTHSFAQAGAAVKLGADYISVGPIFATPSKPLTRPVGLKLLKKVLLRFKIPVVAIGGIDEGNIRAVRAAGAQRVAVIRAADFLRAAGLSVMINSTKGE